MTEWFVTFLQFAVTDPMRGSAAVAISALNHVLLRLARLAVQESARLAASVIEGMPEIQQETVFLSANVQVSFIKYTFL